MSSQRGIHWEKYILPHVEQYTEGRSFMEGFTEGTKGALGLSGIIQAWLEGSLKTLLSPAIPALLDMAKVDRPHFYDTEGVTDLDRARGMLTGWLGIAYIQMFSKAPGGWELPGHGCSCSARQLF